MDIKTQASVSGFIVGDARLQQTKTGEPMLTVRVGQERFEAAPGGGFTHKYGDIVTIAAPELGSLVNRMKRTDACAPWTYGASHLMRYLAGRGLL